MDERYYLAYGSNLSVEQMERRCPGAVYVGTAELKGYRLLFKKSKSGSYLTVEKKRGRSVPLVVWRISEYHEKRLDRFEGCPVYYYKTTKAVDVHNLLDGGFLGTVEGIIYILHEERPLGVPTFRYFNLCMEGYERFGFDMNLMEKAVEESLGKRLAKRWFEAYDTAPANML